MSRLVSELSFGGRALVARWGRPDVVVLVSPALFASALVAVRALGRRRAVGLWIQDFYGLGVQETSVGDRFGVAQRMVSMVERVLAGRVAGVAVIHERMVSTATGLGADPDDIAVIRNWTHVDASPSQAPHAVRQALGWSTDEVVVLHTGNMGAKQHLENVVEAARLAGARRAPVRFVLLGDGNARTALEARSRGVDAVQFIDPVAADQYTSVLAAADVLLVNELPGLRGMAVPSKLTSYFASGKPVIAATDAMSLTADEVARSQAGVVVPPDRPDLLLEAAVRLSQDGAEADRLGENGRRYREAWLTLDASSRAFSDWLRRLRRARRRGGGSPALGSRRAGSR